MAKTTSRSRSSRVRTPPRPSDEADECFVIMPFGGWFDEYYQAVYCAAIKAAGLVPRRTDDLYRPSAIVHDIWSYTKSCKLVLADLTGKNPNVFYELGLAHGIAKPAILVAESISDVPFDLRALRVLEYDKNDPGWGETLRGKVTAAIREVLNSPLQSVLPSFLELSQTPRTPVTEEQKELLALRQEMELIKRELGRSREPELPPDRGEIDGLLRRYLRSGVSEAEIVEKLASRGVRPSWIVRRLNQLPYEPSGAARPTSRDADEAADGGSSPDKLEP